jgi:glycosyltransferase involved in cell wall biosynthesis
MLRLVGTLVGDIQREAPARTKYGLLFEALEQHWQQSVPTIDVTLRGWRRLANGLITFHPNLHMWKERFYQNIPAFVSRSQKTGQQLAHLQATGQADVVLQVGVTFDSTWGKHSLPVILDTDYTTHMAIQNPEAGRSPFTAAQGQHLLQLEKQAYTRSAHIFTRSDMVRESILENYGIAENKITAVGGGVNFKELPTVNKSRDNGRPTILFIGKDFYRKGGDLLLQAFAQTREHIPHARLIMVTEGPIPTDLPLDGVDIVPPTWNREVIHNLYREADLFVLPSRLETWGDVLLEAMAYGLPCIGATRQAMNEIISHGETGLVVPPGDGYALYSAMLWLMINPWLRGKWGRAGRERLETHFTWPCVVEKMAPIIEEVAAKSRK